MYASNATTATPAAPPSPPSPSSRSSCASEAVCVTAAQELRGHIVDAASLFPTRLPYAHASMASITARGAPQRCIAAYWAARVRCANNDNKTTQCEGNDNKTTQCDVEDRDADTCAHASRDDDGDADAATAVVAVVAVVTNSSAATTMTTRRHADDDAAVSTAATALRELCVLVSFDYAEGFCVRGELCAQGNDNDDNALSAASSLSASSRGDMLVPAPHDVQTRRYESLLSLLIDLYLSS